MNAHHESNTLEHDTKYQYTFICHDDRFAIDVLGSGPSHKCIPVIGSTVTFLHLRPNGTTETRAYEVAEVRYENIVNEESPHVRDTIEVHALAGNIKVIGTRVPDANASRADQ